MTKSSLSSRQDSQSADPANFQIVSWLPCDNQPPDGASKYMAVISDDDLDPRLDDLLMHARSLGALAAVKLIAAEDTQLHVFLENSVSSNFFPDVEALWQQVANKDGVPVWSLAFSNVSEVLSGYSDYAHWAYAKQIIEGLQEFVLYQLDPCRYTFDIDEHRGGFDSVHLQIYQDMKQWFWDNGPSSAGFKEIAEALQARYTE